MTASPRLASGRADARWRRAARSELVAERIAEPEVDPVFALGELVHDLHALCLELVKGLPGVLGREADGEPARALADQLPNLLRRLGVHPRRSRQLEEYVARGIPGNPDGQPAHDAEVKVIAHLEPKLADVEVERLLLVKNEDVRDVD